MAKNVKPGPGKTPKLTQNVSPSGPGYVQPTPPPAIAKPAAPATSSVANSGARRPSYSPSQSFVGGGSPSGFDALSVAPSEEDYLAGDSGYQATIAALLRQMEGFQADIDSQRANRKLDYDSALKDLGYRAPAEPGGAANWNWDDLLTASGRAYQNNSNDFASRGMLQSQAYADSINNLQRSLMDQFNGIDQTNTQFNNDLDRQLAKTRDENTSAQQQARADAIMRRNAQYGFGS